DINTVVKTKSGPVRGKILKTLFDEIPYYAFKGIPYAEPPVKKLRFKKRAVLFYIHGGGYAEGSGNDHFYGPDFFLNEDVIVVTHNYRVGVLGFMSLGTPEFSGNMGLKDQNLALKWVSENIERFGGDPNSITIFGHSAGASSAHFHTLSPESNSLFHRAIPMSGSALNVWATYPPGDQMLHLFMIAKSTGTSVYSDKDLKKFLLNVDGKYFVENVDTSVQMNGLPRKELELIWAPVIERKNAIKPFIQTSPEDILDKKLNNKIDTMFGYTSAEMLFLISEEVNNPKLLEPFDKTFQLQLTRNRVETYYDGDEYKQLAKEIRNFYFKEDAPISNETLAEYNDLMSDLFMIYGIDKSARAHAKHSNGGKSYYYRFSVEGRLNAFKAMFKTESMSGASHGDELCYLFRCRMFEEVYANITADSLEMKTIRAVTKLWTNFAKSGNPTPNAEPIELKPLENDLVHFIDITNQGLIAALGPNKKFLDFWSDILGRHDSHVKMLKARDEL
ncbi:Esterase B1, partial [Pseudolycoriella hygida]